MSQEELDWDRMQGWGALLISLLVLSTFLDLAWQPPAQFRVIRWFTMLGLFIFQGVCIVLARKQRERRHKQEMAELMDYIASLRKSETTGSEEPDHES